MDEPSIAGLAGAYHAHRQALERFLRARTNDPAEAEDVLQELWLRLQSARTGPVANPRSYLFGMAQNLVLDRRREAARRASREEAWADVVLDQQGGRPEPADATSAEASLINAELATRIAAAIAELPPGAQRVFRLHKLEGLSHLETAAQLGISRKGVEKNMATALAHLRLALADEVG